MELLLLLQSLILWMEDTSATSTTIVDADRIVLNDDGTMKQVAVTDLNTYLGRSIFN